VSRRLLLILGLGLLWLPAVGLRAGFTFWAADPSRSNPHDPKSSGIPASSPQATATPTSGFPGRNAQTCLSFGGKMWVMGGSTNLSFQNDDLNDVWSSSDGTHWVQVTAHAAWSPRVWAGGVVFNGAMWILGGSTYTEAYPGLYGNDVWSSTDGVNWTQATASAGFSGRAAMGCYAYGGDLWVVGGAAACYDCPVTYQNDSWYSPDGTNWTPAPAGTAFPGRSNFGALVFNGAMWLFGGDKVGGSLNDVWSSTDGSNWTEATASAGFPANGAMQNNCAVNSGAMWIVGGGNNGGNLDGVWTSTNGSSWTAATTSPAFGGVVYNSVVSYNNQLWELAGQFAGSTYSNAVWTSSNGVLWTQTYPQ